MKTTSKFLLLLACFFASHSLSAQVSFGVKGGLNIANLLADYPAAYEAQLEDASVTEKRRYHAGPHAGFWTNITHSERLSTQVELLLSEKGHHEFTYLNNQPETTYSHQARFRYLALPIVEQFHFGKWGFELGVQPSYLLSEEFKSNEENWSKPLLSTGFYNDFDFGALVGAFYEFNRLELGLRFDQSIISASDFEFTDENGESLGDFRHYNQALQLSVKYKLVDFTKS